MKYIITETQRHYLRRLPLINNLINICLKDFEYWDSPKVNVDYMINFLTTDVAELYLFRENDDIYVNGDEYDELTNFIESYLNSSWREKIENYIKTKRRL
jgi:hypothetical protein